MKIVRSLAVSCSFVLLASLAGCQQSDAPASDDGDVVATGPDARPGISGSNGRLVLPPISGRPAAVYFRIRNDGPGAATLAGVHVSGAGQAQMHKTEGGSMSAVESLPLDAGASVEFEPGGLHVMAFDLDSSLKAGGHSELTLTFSDGDKLSMPLRVETMSGEAPAGADMTGMEH